MLKIGIIIAVAVIGIIVIAILLKILSRHFVAYLVFLSLAALGIMIASFAMPRVEDKLNWGWVISQALFIFLFCVSLCAGFAFDTDEIAVTDSTGYWDGDTFRGRSVTKLENRSLFWSVLGGGLFVAVLLTVLNYVIFKKHAIALGIVGCIAFLFAAIMLIRYIVLVHRARHRRDYY
ncbi:MAG: hypothetical protein K2N22_05630 [Clostridia bacterium]|nr:hypothetical protein [Clostridia bacterium]